jgi:hypothetical protein
MKEKCPKCKKLTGLEILYGIPTEEDAKKAKQGLGIPGGFKPKSGPVYRWNCANCGHLWGKAY